MKKYPLFLCLVFMSVHLLFAQANPKPVQKESAPTQKEMEEAIKEAQKEMDNMSPEDKRALDSMGFKMPSMKNVPKVTDKQLATAWEDENRLVPKKDVARLSSIPATPSESGMSSFITTVHTAVVKSLSAGEKGDAETIDQSLRQNVETQGSNAAIGLWLGRKPIPAMYTMGKNCQGNPGNVENLNNYAAMLIMAGAEQAAIPILLNLNGRFPGNSTLLNNIGQAWFGLGDIDKASKYLDSAIRVYAYHSQANFTKCLIEESKGNTTAAVEAMLRSIRKSYSNQKESKLRKLGKKLTGKDVDFPFPMPQDPLGLEKFSWPGYPKSVQESRILETAWNAFREKCEAEINQLNAKSAQLEQEALKALQKRNEALIQASNSGKLTVQVIPWYAPVASLKLNYLVDDKDGKLEHEMKRRGTAWAEVQEHIRLYAVDKKAAEDRINEKYEPLIGEGRPNPLAAYCSDINTVRTQYLEKANSEIEMFYKGMLEEERKITNDQVYYAQYINWPEDFEVIKIHSKLKWLTLIKDQTVQFEAQGPFCVLGELDQEKIKNSTKLQAFDEVACQYHSSMELWRMKIQSDCSILKGELDLPGAKYTRSINSDENDRLIGASLELTVGAGKGIEKGPVSAEVKAEIKGKLEWDDKEITNWEVSSEVGASAGSNLGHADRNIDIVGASAHIGMNSGSSVSAKILSQSFTLNRK
jgi:tetratricopeptide (TPR) repeat protein